MSDASRTQLTYRPETTWAETPPANATMTLLRFTGESFGQRNATVISEEIRSDRQRTNMELVGVDAAGDISQEMIYGAEFEAQLQAALCGTWGTPSANNIRNGVVNRSFLIEKGFLDIGRYIYVTGAILDRMTIDITSRRIATMTTSWMGQKAVAASTTVAGVTALTAAATNPPMKSGASISLLAVGGSNTELNGVTAKRLTLEINNNLRTREIVTSIYGAEPGRGTLEITGTLETYFQDTSIYTQFLANGYFGISFQVADASRTTANAYKFILPSVKLSDAPIAIPGNNADTMQPLSFRALLDPATGYAVNVQRAISITVP